MIRWIQILLHVFLGVSAIGAGLAFVRDPGGSALGMSREYLDRSPFPDFRVPGLFLIVVIGGANLVSAFALLRRNPRAPFLSLATGLLLVAWVAIQTAIIGFRHWSQAIWWVTFPVVSLLGALLVQKHPSPRDEERATRRINGEADGFGLGTRRGDR